MMHGRQPSIAPPDSISTLVLCTQSNSQAAAKKGRQVEPSTSKVRRPPKVRCAWGRALGGHTARREIETPPQEDEARRSMVAGAWRVTTSLRRRLRRASLGRCREQEGLHNIQLSVGVSPLRATSAELLDRPPEFSSACAAPFMRPEFCRGNGHRGIEAVCLAEYILPGYLAGLVSLARNCCPSSLMLLFKETT